MKGGIFLSFNESLNAVSVMTEKGLMRFLQGHVHLLVSL